MLFTHAVNECIKVKVVNVLALLINATRFLVYSMVANAGLSWVVSIQLAWKSQALNACVNGVPQTTSL